MVRIKQTAVKSLGVAKRKKLAKKASQARSGGEGGDASPGGSGGEGGEKTKRVVINIKGRRRYRSGTVAVREIRKYTKSTNLLFPKAPFHRLVREVAQNMNSSARFTSSGMLAIHEAAEQFITEKFIKADMARRHAKRKTLHIDDIRFTPYMTHIMSEVVGNHLVG